MLPGTQSLADIPAHSQPTCKIQAIEVEIYVCSVHQQDQQRGGQAQQASPASMGAGGSRLPYSWPLKRAHKHATKSDSAALPAPALLCLLT
jgi:hypothetical protein